MLWNDLIPYVRLRLGAVISTNPLLAVFSREEQRINGSAVHLNGYGVTPNVALTYKSK